ncbi:MAG TPA: DUF1565 domain-containing protein [Candidatus Bathyarchaeia archaeon]|nr:DUF1565 domain-containing protein [Candidatus Bathyarchaeia archaeon]
MKIQTKRSRLVLWLFLATMAAISTLLSVGSLPTAHAATTYYVATNGNDSNPGTSTAPFATIQKAADIVNPGDTVIVRNGIYAYSGADDGYLLNINRSGTESAPITFKSENLYGAVISGNASGSRDADCLPGIHGGHSGINVGNNVSYVRIEGFEIKNFLWGGIWINSGASHHITAYRNKIHDIGQYYDYCRNNGYLGKVGTLFSTTSHDITFDSNIIYNIGRLNEETSGNLPGGYYLGGTYFAEWSLGHNYWHDQGIYLQGNNHTIVNNLFYNITHGWPVSGYFQTSGYHIINNTFAGPPNPTTGATFLRLV